MASNAQTFYNRPFYRIPPNLHTNNKLIKYMSGVMWILEL